jgi:hypothetical protein
VTAALPPYTGAAGALLVAPSCHRPLTTHTPLTVGLIVRWPQALERRSIKRFSLKSADPDTAGTPPEKNPLRTIKRPVWSARTIIPQIQTQR